MFLQANTSANTYMQLQAIVIMKLLYGRKSIRPLVKNINYLPKHKSFSKFSSVKTKVIECINYNMKQADITKLYIIKL